MNPNEDIKKAIRTADLKFWEISREIGCTDSTFSRKLRFDLTEEFRSRILKAIEKLLGRRNEDE